MDLNAVMAELGSRVNTIEGLRAYPYPADTINPPAVIVGYPEITYDLTMRRGRDMYTVPLWLMVPVDPVRTGPARLAPYLAGAGEKSVKAVVESGTYTSFDTESLQVASATPQPLKIADVDYEAYRISVDLAGPGDS